MADNLTTLPYQITDPAAFLQGLPPQARAQLQAQFSGAGTPFNSPQAALSPMPFANVSNGATGPQAPSPAPQSPSGTTPQTGGARPPFSFPQFNTPGFPYANLPQQISAAFSPQQFSNGSQYGRWNGVNNNAFGLFPNQFQPLFGTNPGGGGMAFQPPYANMSNQGVTGQPQSSAPQSGAGQSPATQGVDQQAYANSNFTDPSSSNYVNPAGVYNRLQMGIQAGNPLAMQGLQSFVGMGGGGMAVPQGLQQYLGQSSPGGYQGQMPQLPQGQMPQLQSQPQPQGLLGQPQTYSQRQIGSQYAPGTTLSMRTGLPAGQSGNGLTPAQSPQQQPLGPGQYATNFFTPGMPQSFTVDQFNQARQSNPALAYQMATHAGQDYRNAIMQQDGMNNGQFNQWLNNAAYNQGGLNYRFGS